MLVVALPQMPVAYFVFSRHTVDRRLRCTTDGTTGTTPHFSSDFTVEFESLDRSPPHAPTT